MAGPEVENEQATRAAADPASSIAFRSAVVAATRATDDVARRAALRNAAGAAIALAVNGAESELRSLLTPDPVNANVTWSVACYQIGDLTPSAVRDFADAAEAVSTVSACNDIGHVAAELVASTNAGLRWVALVRTNTTTQLRLPDADATSDSTGQHASELGDAQRRWRRRIAAWAEGTALDVDLEAPAGAATAGPGQRPSRSTRTRDDGGRDGGAEVASLREQLSAIERQLARLDSVITGGAGTDEDRAGRLHAVLAEVEARLVDASLDTRSGLANVEHRLGERVASVRDTLVRGLDASSTSAADTRELVDARSSAIAEALRTGVRDLGEQLTANERRLAELTAGLGGVVDRLDRLDQQARTNLEQVRATVRDDLAELADHLDAGHGVLDRRRQRAHDELLAAVDAARGESLDEVRSGAAATAAAVTEATERVLASFATQAADVDAAADLVLTAVTEQRDAVDATREQLLAAVAGQADHTTSAADVVLDAIAESDGSARTAAEAILGAVAEREAATAAAVEHVLEAVDVVDADVRVAVAQLLAAAAEQGSATTTATDAILHAVTAQGGAATSAKDAILAAVTDQGDATSTAIGELLVAIDRASARTGSTAEQILAAVAEQGSATSTAADAILHAVTDQGDAAGTAIGELLVAIDRASARTGGTAEQILAAVAEQGSATSTAIGELLAAVDHATETTGATVEQLRLDLADTARAATSDRAEQHRRLAATVEEARRELVNDAAITRGTVDGSLEGATARVIRQLTAQVELARSSSKADLAAAVIALRDEQQRERHLEARRRTGADDVAQAAVLAAVERLHDRIDQLEASQQALRESLVGP